MLYSEGEVMAVLVAAALSLALWGSWFWHCTRGSAIARPQPARGTLFLLPLACLGILFLILKAFSAHDVRDDPAYLLFYLIIGMAWIGGMASLLAFFGLSIRDDAVERRNDAATLAISGALIGLTLCFAGGNIGDGPGWWVVLFSGFLATAGFFVIWWMAARLIDWADHITIDRDVASGIRAAGFFIAVGAVLGRGAAGDWHSAGATLVDFSKFGSLVLLPLSAAVMLEKQYPPRLHARDPQLLLRGWLPALVYLTIGTVIVVLVGWWK